MNLHLKHVIESWEISGQGDGGHINVDFDNKALDYSEEMNDLDQVNDSKEEFGSLRNHSQAALDLGKNFVYGKTYLLYLWQMLNTHDLLHSSMQILNSSTGSRNASYGVPSVVGQKHRFSKDDNSMTNFLKGSRKSKREVMA